ncbi:hypothetical protein HHI36_000768 [Cryptolaemus montrouzieri]|uniref:Uncharacterized protein n=1 Tax=Cryptolaemus montrouzieri TaxID=559131 RepID=A0ABD2P5I3_9CUCU
MAVNITFRTNESDTYRNQLREEYDPYIGREPKTPISNIQALCLLLQGVFGAGMLQSIFIFGEGWLTGIISYVLVGILCTHCVHILLRSQYRLCKQLRIPHLSYAQAMERAMETGPPFLRPFSRLSQ